MPDEYLPLLVFPEKRILQPEKGNGFPPGKQNLPGHGAQVDRIGRQIEHLEEDFARYQASLTGALAGLEPEMVLVIEIVGRLDDFRQAAERSHVSGNEQHGGLARDSRALGAMESQ